MRCLPRVLVTLTFLFVSALLSPSFAAAWGQPSYEDGVAGKLKLDTGWTFRHDPANSGLTQRWFAEDADMSGWEPAAVPHTFTSHAPLLRQEFPGSVAWYRVRFDAPQLARTVTGWKLRFESVAANAQVWVNGRPVGSHEGAHLPFEVPAPLKATGNVLVVRVSNQLQENTLPGPMVHWWNWGGLLREVYLRPVDRLDISDVVQTSRIARRCAPHVKGRCRAWMTVAVSTRNESAQAQRYVTDIRVAGRTRRLAATIIRPGRTVRQKLVVRLARPRLWSPNHPNRYRLDVRVRDAGSRQVLSAWNARVGVRRIGWKHNKLTLNYRPLRLFGASLHEMDETGGAITDKRRDADIMLLRKLGANLLRSHYPLSPRMLEAADKYGIMVWDEVPSFMASPGQLRDRKYHGRVVRYTQAMIRRDRSHPSVAIWSLGNEPLPPHEGALRRHLRSLVSAVHRLDRSRPTAMALFGSAGWDRDPEVGAVDIIGLNMYTGWYGDRKPEFVAKSISQGEKMYRDKMLFISEFGAEGNFSGGRDEKGTYEYQRRVLRTALQAQRRNRRVTGSAIWILRDFPVRYEWSPGGPRYAAPWNQKGLVFADGNPKPTFNFIARILRRYNGR